MNRPKNSYWDVDLSKLKPLIRSDIELVPQPVQNYIIQSGALNKPKVKTARLQQKGQINIKGGKWTPITADQYFNIDKCEFVWKAKAGLMRVVDQFIDNKGLLKVKLLGLIKLGQASGKETDQGEVLRYLCETIWFPSALISSRIDWESISDLCSKATITYGLESASAFFHFGSNGKINKITAKRYAENKGKFELRDWEISNFKYKVFNGIDIPYKGHVSWKLEDREFCYYKYEITRIDYNINRRF